MKDQNKLIDFLKSQDLFILMSLKEILTSIKWDITKILKKEFIFTIFLLGITI